MNITSQKGNAFIGSLIAFPLILLVSLKLTLLNIQFAKKNWLMFKISESIVKVFGAKSQMQKEVLKEIVRFHVCYPGSSFKCDANRLRWNENEKLSLSYVSNKDHAKVTLLK